MSRPRFLIDENLARQAIMDGVKRHNAAIDILHVGDANAPDINTLDPDISSL